MEKRSKETISDVGVIVGRFQVHELHPGHHDLINYVCSRHKKIIIFLGVSPLLTTQNNPLDFATRQKMLQSSIAAEVIILPIKDTPSDIDWSENLDEKIREIYQLGSVTLYGGRDSFVSHYHGKFQTEEIGEEIYISGTGIREHLRKTVGNSKDFRAGVIYAAFNQYPSSKTTVDVAILKGNELLLGRKLHQTKFRFIGGFSEPEDESYESDAKREVLEETGVEIDNLNYVCSLKIDDWRYRNEVDKIKTIFYTADYIFGKPVPADDIVELKWFHIDAIKKDDVVAEHQPLLESFLKRNRKENKLDC